MNNLKNVLQNLKSDKIKERQEGLASIRTVFAQDKVVANFHINRDGEGDPRAWLSVFQALFQAVLNEKLAATKKVTGKSAGSAVTAQRRLADAASAVRWLTEKTSELMNKRVVKALFEHLLQTMVHKGEILTPVALDYIKALRCIVSYTPHLEHMEDDTWIRIVEMGFNVILGDPIKSTLQPDPAVESPARGTEADNSDLYDEDDPMGDGEDEDVLPSTSKKRARSDSSSTQRPSFSKLASQSNQAFQRRGSVSLEQVEFMSIISILLRSPSAPILASNHNYLPSSILIRLERFLNVYSPDTSLVQDYVSTVSSTLAHLSLNRTHDVTKFARKSWINLVALWGTKNKRMKEGLLAVLRVLFPFVTTDNEIYQVTPFDCAEGMRKLWNCFEDEAESRGGVEGLSLESLRLEPIGYSVAPPDSNSAFVAETFRSGWNFDAGQALAWAILELQADCAGKLFQLSESMSINSTSGSARNEGKRPRMENPIPSLILSIQQQSAPNFRAYHFQVLLFFIDRHWSIVHHTLQQDVVQALLQCVSFDDVNIQSWVLLCFAAIAHAETSNTAHSRGTNSNGRPPKLQVQSDIVLAWDSIWTNAIRRVNVPAICRAACHTAHILLVNSQPQIGGDSRIPLSSQRILSEIEALGKDLDVQGPVYPYDSVCIFLSQCLKIAGQDMRLYRMQLEEKVLSWLIDCWKVVGMGRKRMSLHTVKDLMLLLESICGLAKRSNLLSRVPLPDCQVVDVLVEEAKAQVIRDFLLNAHLPPFGRVTDQQTNSIRTPSAKIHKPPERIKNDPQLAQPRGRERKLSVFFLRALEALVSEWEDSPGNPTAEMARRSLDMAVTALSFESTLVLNGTQPNRRLIQCACKLAGIVTTILRDARWTTAEKALVLLGLDPLLFTGQDRDDGEQWEAMLPPDIGTGIKSQNLKLLNPDETNNSELVESRIMFLRIIWQHPDVQDAFIKITETIRIILRVTLGDAPIASNFRSSDRDDKDDFGPIRTAAAQQTSEMSEDDRHFRHYILEICVGFLTVGPNLQSASGEPTRDNELTETVLECAEDRHQDFFLILPIFLDKIRQRILNITAKNLDSLLTELGRLLELYAYARSQYLQTLTTQLLNATLDLWALNEGTIGDILHKVQLLCAWLSGALKRHKIRSWRVRDSLARFLDAYLLRDQREMAWAPRNDNETDEEKEGRLEVSPTHLLPFMNADEDIRVRFRVAVINARLFVVARILQSSPMEMYGSIKKWYTNDIDNYEHILTRMLSLGNIMIISSAVRRGPYWHLLETCLYSSDYSRHIESVLRGVSERLGLASFSVLFTSYASQLAFSIRKVEWDILRFPPHLLGYRDRKECAELTFRSFTPINVWQGGDKLFEGHCKVLQKTVKSGLLECFGDILGYRIVAWVDEHEFPSSEMEELLQSKTFRSQEFEDALNHNIDGIIASILRTLGDQDFSDGGPIATALHMMDQTGKTSRVFHALVKYRRIEDFDSHQPNLPVFPAETILRALTWLRTRLPNTDMKATTYHILHQLFADVEQSPLVNEQLRVMNAISIWIAWLNEEFDDATLLHTVIQGATSLLAQSDLARSSQSIIEWAFDRYRARKTKDPRFPDIMIRIACLSHDYTCNAPNFEVAKMGNELRRWIDNEALKISKVVELKGQLLKALPAWPHEPSTHLAKLYETITAESLSGVLEDNQMSSIKFRLVRRLHDPAILKNYNGGNFTRNDFWRLKECIPTMDRLQEADIDAFVALLFRNKGAIDSFGSDRPDSTSLLSKYRRSMGKLAKTTTAQIDKAKEFVVLTLLEMLQSDSASKVNIAYRTLRLIKSASSDGFIQANVWPSEHQTELEYLGACQPRRKMRSPRDITELSTSELFLESIKDFPQWIANITILLTDILSGGYPFYAQLTDILQSDIVFAEVILPILVHTLLIVEKANTESQAASYRTTLSNYFSKVLSSDLTSIPCLRSIVGVILHLRHSSLSTKDALCYNKWLDIDFTLLSRSAIICGAYTTALLFLELAAEDRTSGITRGDDDTSEEQILYEIYRHIDEPDGFYGIDDEDLHQFLMKRFHHEKQWEKAFRFHGATLEAGGAHASDAEGLVDSFHSFGFDRLAIDALQSLSSTNNGSSSSPSTSYRLGWRTETWDLPDRDENTPGVSLYLALRAVHRERDSHIVNSIIQHGLSHEMSRLRTLGPENLAEIRETVQDLMSLREIAKWRTEAFQNHLHSRHLETAHWKEFIDIDQGFEFSNLENIMATRISLVRSVRQKEERQRIGTFITPFAQSLIDVEKKCLVRLSEAARDASQIQIALNSVVRAQLLEKTPSFSVLQEFASVLWVQKEEQVAVQYLSRLAPGSGAPHQHIEESVDLTQQAALLARLGTWSSEACLKKPADINSQYMIKAATLLEAVEPTLRQDSCLPHALVYHECAIFAERQYQSIINSPDVIRWKMYVDRKRQEIQSRDEEIKKTTDESKTKFLESNQGKAKRVLEEDIKSFDRHNEARETFLKQAIEMYSQCLKTSNTFDVDGAIRLCSLWFANFDEDGVQDGVRDALERVPSQKFVFLAHQLSARISTPEAGLTPKNQQSLQGLVVRMCQDHPFHSLYQVYCLRPEHTPGASLRRQSGRHNPSSAQNERAMAARSIFDRLRTDPMGRERVRQVEMLSDACIEWAKYPIAKNAYYKNTKTKHFPIPTQVKITKISHFQVPVMTYDTPLDPTMRYDNCAWIEKYEKTFETAGGINLPKINLCYDTSGRKHKQLFKGEGSDDMRQDAVMEQVFQLVNNVLSRDRETRRRDLNIRCYKVIPLTSQAGVLEFVGNTLPLKDWLIRAHPRYRPKDLSLNEAGKLLREKQDELTPTIKTNHEALIEHFKLVKEKFKPVMRHYFTETHKTPISWFAMRLKYTRSVATTSIVGHILGLGDRHISNILLDNVTGQVVHIDLGIAFEQGKLLTIGETVPFRMTRDMVDGMGISGTKGVFQRCAEETLRVLRDDSEVIMTVLEVFKHDPLHSWTASDVKVQRAQKEITVNTSNTTGRFGIGIDMSSGTEEEAADRALSSVARKLDKALSVQYTVNQLVTDATHDDNLGIIYSGWSPHC